VTSRPTRNVAASVRQRRLNLAEERGEEFQLVLSRYAVERLQSRLSISEHRDRFDHGASLDGSFDELPESLFSRASSSSICRAWLVRRSSRAVGLAAAVRRATGPSHERTI
jgi:hypothetical protein